jgi:hypothetical protein
MMSDQKLKFTYLQSGGSLPANMYLFMDRGDGVCTVVASVDYSSRYEGQTFKFIDSGKEFTGVFINTSNPNFDNLLPGTNNNTGICFIYSNGSIINPTPTPTMTPTMNQPTGLFDTSLKITSGNSASSNGVTLYGQTNTSILFDKVPLSSISNPLSIQDIKIYISGVWTYKITTFSEIVSMNKPFTIFSENNGGVLNEYSSSFGAGSAVDASTRRIDL